jgi:hypothetical protein
MENASILDGAANSHATSDGPEGSCNRSNGVMPSPTGHKRSLSGSILSKLSFLRAGADETQAAMDHRTPPSEYVEGDDVVLPKKTGRAMAVAVQQQKTRRRKGSLRKAALLGRGAQRETRESKSLPLDTHQPFVAESTLSPTSPEETNEQIFGLGISESTPRPSMDGYASRTNNSLLPSITTLPMGAQDRNVFTSTTSATSPTMTYTSTTDEEDILSMNNHLPPPLRDAPLSSGSDSYFPPLSRRRSTKTAKSPLSVAGIATTPLPPPDTDWDYSETEWWGWVILICTWIVFVVGMGSCLGVWSWAWDVGETPYAPPELEDDPTLPIVGYYPALIILTAVMAWVWVVVAWVGMKYFRHAKISGD